MHITEGIITGYPAAAYTAGGLALMSWGTWRMKQFAARFPDKKALLGMGGALIFFVSLIPLPAFTGTCTHPCGVPLIAILLGPAIGIALAGLSLLLQAAFFAHGGFSTWGANVLALGLAGAVSGWLVFRGTRKLGAPLWLAGGAAGLIGDLMVYAMAGLILALTLSQAPEPQYSFAGYLAVIYTAYLPTQLPIAIGEMFITGLAIHYAFKQRPEVLVDLGVVPRAAAPVLQQQLLILILGLALSLVAGFWQPVGASEPVAPPAAAAEEKAGFTGMDEAVNERLSELAGLKPREPYINLESKGDLWNAALLLGGGICGFILGRWWHLLFSRRGPQTGRMVNQPEAT